MMTRRWRRRRRRGGRCAWSGEVACGGLVVKRERGERVGHGDGDDAERQYRPHIVRFSRVGTAIDTCYYSGDF